MIFNSITFFCFFSVVSLLLLFTNINLKINKDKILLFRHIILLVSSYVFYGWWNWKCAFLMLVLTLISYWSSLRVEKTKRINKEIEIFEYSQYKKRNNNAHNQIYFTLSFLLFDGSPIRYKSQPQH